MGRFGTAVTSRPGVAVVASLATLAVIGGVTAVRAAIPDSSGVIHACYKTAGGALIVVDGAKTPACAPGSRSLAWPTSMGLSGLREFTSSGAWMAPEAVTHVFAEAFGGGGAGGDSTSASNCPGGSGGGASYLRAVVPVVPGRTYAVTVGSGGTFTARSAGGSGGASTMVAGNSILFAAGGGQGGGIGTSTPGTGGAAGSGSIVVGSGLTRRGSGAQPALCELGGAGGPGYPTVAVNVAPSGVGGGGIGTEWMNSTKYPGGNGQPGYILLSW